MGIVLDHTERYGVIALSRKKKCVADNSGDLPSPDHQQCVYTKRAPDGGVPADEGEVRLLGKVEHYARWVLKHLEREVALGVQAHVEERIAFGATRVECIKNVARRHA